ncbi:hypothetical protein GGI20_005316 [Coemansia sp. BCRC 34301]|nr:hypothetical protein GGI20_005316 [Coemansia sp. BCRC 34301]
MSDPINYDKGELRLATETKALYSSQCNRRFAWGLTVSGRKVCTYVFGPDDIWSSNDIDITSADGRRELVSLLVDWSLCSVDSHGFDPSIRYVDGNNVFGVYLEIGVHEKDASTGEMASRTYYSNKCVVAANLIGRRAKCFAASTSIEAMDDLTVMVKDMWLPLSSDPSDDTRDVSSVLNTLHSTYDGDSMFGDKFPQLVSTRPVYVYKGDGFGEDTTATAFAGLSDGSQGFFDRQHKRTVMGKAEIIISTPDHLCPVPIAIAVALTTFSAAQNNLKRCRDMAPEDGAGKRFKSYRRVAMT